MTETAEFSLASDDGVEVFARAWKCDEPPRAIVLVAHGMSEHSGRYDRVARVLCEAGAAVYALDHRGHGRTAAATGAGRTGATGMDGLLADIGRLRDTAQAEYGDGVPVVLFGHSMGALLALGYAERAGRGLAGLVLSGSPGAREGVREQAQQIRSAADGGLGDEPLAALASFAGESSRTPYDWLSRDEAEVDAYIADPLCGDDVPMTYGFLADLFALVADEIEPDAIAQLPKSMPILLLTGEADPVSNGAEGVRELEARLRAASLTVEAIYYPDARHEVLNEINRDEVHADLVGWLTRL